ncbi:MAG: hypothetical protein AABZ64_18300 [Nitrospinota bacterium]
MPVPLLFALFRLSARGATYFLYEKARARGMVAGSFLAAESFFFAAAALLFGCFTGDLRPNLPSLL